MLKRCLLTALALLFLLLSGCTVKVKQSETDPYTSDYLQIVTLTVAGIGLHLSDTCLSDEEMLRTFEKNSGTRITVKRSGYLSAEEDYFDYLNLLERSASLPDLLIFPSLPEMNQKNILIDLEKYIADDEEYLQIPTPLREATSYSVGIPAVPLRYYLEGYFVHSSSFSKEDITAPFWGASFTRFFSSIQSLASKSKELLPLGQFYEIPLWYPAIQEKNPTLWGAYDGTRFFFDHIHLKDGVSYASQLREACFPNTLPEELPKETDNSLLKKWKSGNLALYYGSTQRITEIADTGFSIAFSGIPGGRPLIDADYIGITTSCSYKEEAFALLKWLSYGKEGLQRRYSNSSLFPVGSPPLNSDPKLLKLFFDQNPYDGIREAVNAIESAIVKGDDYIPDYHTYVNTLTYSIPDISEQEQTVTEWLAAAIDGSYSYYQYASKLDELVNWRETEL